MKHVLKKYWPILILLVIIWGVGIFYGYQLEQNKSQVSIRIKAGVKDKFTVEELNALYESEKSLRATELPGITGFEEMGRTEILEPVTGRRIVTDYSLVWGDKSLVYEHPLIYGSYGIWDPQECIITTQAAKELFQSNHVEGLKLVWNNKEWTIRGVIDYKRSAVLFTARAHDSLSNLELTYPKGIEIGLATQEMLFRNGLNKDIVIIDYSLFWGICRLFYMLPSFYLLWIGFRIIKRQTKKKGIVVFEVVVFALLCFLLASQTFRFPVTFIPSKWSDFDFWVNRWKETIANVKEIRALVPFEKDVLLIRNAAISITASLLAGFGIVICGEILIRNVPNA